MPEYDDINSLHTSLVVSNTLDLIKVLDINMYNIIYEMMKHIDSKSHELLTSTSKSY